MLELKELLYAFEVWIFTTVFIWCMEEGNILYPYYKWLERKKFEWNNGEFWTKPLGLCSFCFTFWASIFWGVFIVGLYPVSLILFCFTVMFFDRIRTKSGW